MFLLRDGKPILVGSAVLLVGGYALYRLWRHHRTSKETELLRKNVYETQRALNGYLLFHYGSPQVQSLCITNTATEQNFPQRCAEECIKHTTQQTGVPSRALDIGCAVGRASFELARVFQEVVGIDFSHSFVNACNQLKERGQLTHTATTEGDLSVQCTAVVPQDIERSRCLFRQGDACNLPKDLGTFDCVLAGNLICRLPDPLAFLHRLPGLVAPGGILVITSPYTWLEEFTPKSLWLGGYKDDSGKEISSIWSVFDCQFKKLGRTGSHAMLD
ncbi:uncharacterized protein LOC127572124 isoform X2 [Pristis pectinata]|uniref:uncharacterized protein LOC127572124 isoform X2 n=1 Tax=Pristis pectinata TaxID=685728 RepID=UPI00223DBCDD|nr:uncharacterized protein LOC127572124 isoform X2 [Pristis pectinata]